jgi:hypothetical protein
MIADLKPYAEYKESGSKWLGAVPAKWEVRKVMQHLLKDDTQVYKQFVENESFRRFVGDMVYTITSQLDA